ncbi:MAG: inosine/xanthosine triphosphatase [Promethearchaeota archaeon]
MTNITISVGSLNPTKVNAVKFAFNRYFEDANIFKIKAESKVPKQPIGMEQILKGAKNRAIQALNYLINKKHIRSNILGIGIEAGLVNVAYAKTNYMDFQFCVILDENHYITLGSGIAFEYPQSVINEIFSNQQSEVGTIIGKLANNMNLKNESGAIGYLSKGIIKRIDILSQAVICALLPRINRELYEL